MNLKKLLLPLLTLMVLFPGVILAQGVGINGTNSPPAASAGLDIDFINKGLLIPRMSEAQRNAIVNPAYGLLILNTTTDCINMWDGVIWRQSCFGCGQQVAPASNSPVCTGTTLNLTTVQVPGATYAWTGPNGFTSNLQNPTLPNANLNMAGTYSLTVTLNGCVSNTVSISVVVNQTPNAPTAGSNSPVTSGGTINLTASTVLGATYSWTGPSGFTSNLQNPSIPNASSGMSGTYQVVAIANGCTSSVATVNVVVSSTSFQTFTSNGTFVVPNGVTSVRVLCVGGGGGGANGHQGGGGSGFVASGTYTVTPGQSINVTVGTGGTAAVTTMGTNNITGNTPGGSSAFGGFISSNGGGTPTVINGPAGNGGSGGGGSCNAGSPGGNGGTNGTGGGTCNQPPGTGQGSFTGLLSIFSQNTFTPGNGGLGGTASHAGGGGGGGVRMNGGGPNGQNGIQSYSGQGGQGYGGGGGAGSYDSCCNERWAGGNGAAGIVYVEW